MIAPAVARLIADAVTGVVEWRRSRPSTFARFEEKRPAPEPQLV
jgi:hypothetical protein